MGEFQNRLKSLRVARGMTQDELSKALKISRSAIGMYESGSREPDFETLEVIADYFNVDTDYLIGRSSKTTLLPEAVALVERYLALDPYDRGRVDQMIDDLLEKKTNRMEDNINVG